MKKRLLQTMVLLAALAVILASILVVRAITTESLQPEVTSVEHLDVSDSAVQRLSDAIQIPTISPTDYSPEELAPFEELHAFLEESYPRVHAELQREVVGPCSLLYTWPGKDEEARPAVLMSHLDVVPVSQQELPDWTHPPFSGAVADGFIWGRGALDVKVGVLGILEAAEALLEQGDTPQHTFYFAFGCDEEIGGSRGAKEIAELLQERDIKPVYVLDEGLVITEGIMPGVDRPVALIGVAEKGFWTLTLTVRAEGGHSSMPPSQTAIGILAGAVDRMESSPMKPYLNEPARQMFESLAAEMPFGMKMVFANLWLFEPVLIGQLVGAPQTNASVRTTAAPTIFNAGTRENVLPQTAQARINFRVAPGQTIEDVEDYLRAVIDDDRVEISRSEGGFTSDPSPTSSIETAAFEHVRRTTREIFGEETIVIPGLMVGGTDSRWFTEIADDVYRFLPTQLSAEDTKRIHGVDERVGVENYHKIIRYYARLIISSEPQK